MEKFSKLKKIMVKRKPKKRKQKFKYVTINFIVTYLNISLGFSCGSDGKESICNVGDLGSIPGLGRSPGEGKGYALQYSGLENFMDYIVHWVTKSQTRLSNFHFHFPDVPTLLSSGKD